MSELLPDTLPPGEHAADELEGAAAVDAVSASLARIEEQLRGAPPDFYLHARVKALTVTPAPKGVFVDVTFRKGQSSPGIPNRLRFAVSRAWAESLRGQLTQVLRKK